MQSWATNFMRAAIARAVTHQQLVTDQNYEAPYQYAVKRWGPHGVPVLLKAAAGAISADPLSTVGAKDDEFFSAVLERSLLGRLTGLRSVPFNVRMLRMTTSLRGYWVSQSKAIPVRRQVLTGSTLPRKKVACIWLATNESLEHANLQTEQRLEEDALNAITTTLDEAFIDSTNGGDADTPAAVTAGAPYIVSNGDPAVDIASLIATFTGDLLTAFFITDPVTAATIAQARDAAGSFQFPDCGPRGGSLLGIPLVTTRGSPRDSNGGQIALVDVGGIASRMEGIEVARSNVATIECDDEPTGATDTPVAQSAHPVSLFQTDTTAFRGTVFANWDLQRTGGVVIATECDYMTLLPAS